MGRFVKVLKNSIQVYEDQGSLPRALGFMLKYAARRGPVALSRSVKRFSTVPAASRASDELSLAVLVSGGIGDQIVTARYMRDLSTHRGPFKFDVFSPSPSVAEWVFRSVPGVGKHFLDSQLPALSSSYALSLFMPSFIRILHSRLTPEDLDRSPLGPALKHIRASNTEFQSLTIHHPETDGFLAQKLQFRNVTRATSLHSMSATPYGGDLFHLPSTPAAISKFGLKSPWITVHNGFEVQNVTSSPASTKHYPHFDRVIAHLRRDFPSITFIQLGSKTSIPIPSVHHNLISKTSLSEASTIIAGALCHLDNESGLVHIASCHGTPSCVVFGPTPADYFAYPGNISLRPPECGSCWWIKSNWMDRCPRGLEEPVCTYKQDPSVVARSASELIRKALNKAA